MPTLTEKITIDASLADVWPLLSDPETVASCIPGATLTPDQEDDLWKGSISVKFGPTIAVFRGEAELTYNHDKHTCSIEGRGIDQRGASRALANGVVTAAAVNAATEITVEGEYTISGPLETFANAGGVHVARALLVEFAANMSKLNGKPGGEPTVEGSGDKRSASTPYQPIGEPASALGSDLTADPGAAQSERQPSPAGAKELNAIALLWAALTSWISSLIGKGK
jgi:carbon monoxide dehydrogenase subunit G